MQGVDAFRRRSEGEDGEKGLFVDPEKFESDPDGASLICEKLDTEEDEGVS